MPSRRRFLATAGTVATIGLAGCTNRDEPGYDPGTDEDAEWPLPAYDRTNSGYNPDAAGPRGDVTERWSVEIPHPSGRPVVAVGTVLTPTVAGLVALDVGSGEVRWRYGDDQPWTTAPIVSDGTVFAGFADEPGLVALDVETGDVAWTVPTGGAIRAPPTFTHDHDFIYVGDTVGNLYKIDPADGTVLLRGEVFGAVSALAHRRWLTVGTEAGEVYALYDSYDTLAGIWRRSVEAEVTSIAVDTQHAYVGTFGGATYRLDYQRRGGSRWETDDGGALVARTGRDVIACGSGTLKVLDGRSGETAWRQDGRFGAAPAVAGDTVYVGGGEVGANGHGFVAGWNLTGGTGLGPLEFGGERWRYDADSAVVEGLAVADGAVFAVTQDIETAQSRVYALEAA